jgi:DNA end-binding protein Ku
MVLRTKEYLVALRPTDEALQISTLLFADEVVDPGALEDLEAVADSDASDRELAIAEQLIGSLAGPFEAEGYKDQYRERVLDLVERKAQGEQIQIVAAPEQPASPVPDLMSALKASLDAVRERDGGSEDAAEGDGKPTAEPAKKPAARKRTAKKPAGAAKKRTAKK